MIQVFGLQIKATSVYRSSKFINRLKKKQIRDTNWYVSAIDDKDKDGG